MAFWDEWEAPDWIDEKQAMITMILWAVLCFALFKMMYFSMDNVTLFGMPWKYFRYVIAVVMLPLIYIIVKYFDEH